MSTTLDFQVNGLNPSKVGGTGQTVKYFQRILGTNGPNSGPNTNISATNAAGALFLPASGVFEGQLFEIVAAGNYGPDSPGDSSGTVQIDLFAVTGSASSPTYTSIASTGAVTPAYSAGPWAIKASLSGDSVSGLLQGVYTAVVDGALKSSTPAASVVVSGLNFLAGNAALRQGAVMGFVVGATFGTSNAVNAAAMYQFQIATE